MRDRILIVGGGMMGCGIAAAAAAAGENVTIVETNPATSADIHQRMQLLLDELAQNELAPRLLAEDVVEIAENLSVAVRSAVLVIEAIVENLEIKKSLFAQLDSLLPDDVCICSNTSGLRITDIGELSIHKERLLTAHFWFPAHIVPLVEVVMSEHSAAQHAIAVRDRLITWGKAPVIVKRDLPGQLANRILQAVIREASAIVEMDLATPEDVDTAVKMGMGIRFPVWGPLEHVDGVGLDLCSRVQNTVLPDISRETQANSAFTERIDCGALGYKSGNGFYDWSKKDMKQLEKMRNDFIMQSVKFIRSRASET